MEIPTKEVLEKLAAVIDTTADFHGVVMERATLVDSRDTIKAQALEIRELQAGICRLREEMQKMEKIA